MLSKQDERRAMVLGQVSAGLLGIAEAAALIGVGERQVRRLLAAYQGEGPRGIVHGNRGRAPAHATSPELQAQVIALSTGSMRGSTTRTWRSCSANAKAYTYRAPPWGAYWPPPASVHRGPSAGGRSIVPAGSAIPRRGCSSR